MGTLKIAARLMDKNTKSVVDLVSNKTFGTPNSTKRRLNDIRKTQDIGATSNPNETPLTTESVLQDKNEILSDTMSQFLQLNRGCPINCRWKNESFDINCTFCGLLFHSKCFDDTNKKY